MTTQFNADQQAKYDAIMAKHMPMFEESKKLAKEAKAMIKAYKKAGLPMNGEFHKVSIASQKVELKAKKLYSEALALVNGEFWG